MTYASSADFAEDYAQKLKERSKSEDASKLPKTAAELARERIRGFVDACSTVDFDAKLDNRRFVDPAYEHQTEEWKRCFRAGKPAVEAARSLAQEWLRAL